MKKTIIGVVAVIVIIVIAVLALQKDGGEKWNGIEGAPIDIAIGFYTNWIDVKNAEDMDDAADELLETAPLADGLKETLEDNLHAEVDPVMCRSYDEPQLRTIPVFEREDTAQYIMQATRGEFTEGYAVVDLSGRDGQWQIENIECAYGDIAPEDREFNFDQTGGLLKNVPAPYDSNFWHLVFEDRGQIGVVPLRFTDTTTCVTTEGEEVACDDSFLIEAMDAHVYGHMAEDGAEVVRIEAK